MLRIEPERVERPIEVSLDSGRVGREPIKAAGKRNRAMLSQQLNEIRWKAKIPARLYGIELGWRVAHVRWPRLNPRTEIPNPVP